MNSLYKILLSFLLSFLLFSLFFEMITPKEELTEQKIKISSTKFTQSSTEDNISLSQTVIQEKEIRECRDAIDGFSNKSQEKKEACRKNIEMKYKLLSNISNEEQVPKEEKKVEPKSSFAVVNAFHNASAFIMAIYLTLLLTLWVQLYLALTIKDKLSHKENILIEWNINVPPILGVVGTIYSFASFTLVAQQQKGLFDIFKNNFYDAATTTVIGGSFYVINFALAIWIASKIPKEE